MYLATVTISHIWKEEENRVQKSHQPKDKQFWQVRRDHISCDLYRCSHLVESSIARNHKIAIVVIDPCQEQR